MRGRGQGYCPGETAGSRADSHRRQAAHPAEAVGTTAVPSLALRGASSICPSRGLVPGPGSRPQQERPGPGRPRMELQGLMGCPLLHPHPGHTARDTSPPGPQPLNSALWPPHLPLPSRRPCTPRWVGTDPLQGSGGAQRGHGASRTHPAEGLGGREPFPCGSSPGAPSPGCGRECGGVSGQEVAQRTALVPRLLAGVVCPQSGL